MLSTVKITASDIEARKTLANELRTKKNSKYPNLSFTHTSLLSFRCSNAVSQRTPRFIQVTYFPSNFSIRVLLFASYPYDFFMLIYVHQENSIHIKLQKNNNKTSKQKKLMI